MDACRICGGTGGVVWSVPEIMFGTGERYPYFECERCGCVQIRSIPDDLARHYAGPYYSFAPPRTRRRSLRRRLVDRWAYERRGGLVGRLLHARHPNEDLARLREVGVGRADAILDVGCGNGQRVLDLLAAGFTRVQGIDAFIPADVVVGDRVVARRATLASVPDRYRTIMFHHVLEHLPDQLAALRAARERLAPGGAVIVRIPTASSEAWEGYRAHWVQLDAPRHLYLHTRESLGVLAASAGFSIASVRYDSTDFQFWGSEQAKRGIPLVRPGAQGWDAGLFSGRQRSRFRHRARELNALDRGDQFAAVLVPTPADRGA